MSQLSEAIKTKPKVVVTEGICTAEFLLTCDPDFQLMLCPGISDNLEIMVPIHEWSIRNHGPEQIVILSQKGMSIVTREGDFLC